MLGTSIRYTLASSHATYTPIGSMVLGTKIPTTPMTPMIAEICIGAVFVGCECATSTHA